MSSSPKETETFDVDFTREQRWIVHHRVVTLADEALAAGTQPPAWLVDLFERLEAGSSTITVRQATELRADLSDYVTDGETPQADEDVATAALEDLSAIEP
ncbi:hypothetical protein [Halovivax cerinus]|nr:hypothetical protein [Halovivax cerinus]